MPEALGSPPSPRTALFWNGTAWQWALVDAAGHLQIDVLSTVMDAAAPTLVNQALMVTALQLIDNLVVALGGPGNARLIVRGEDQLFSFKEELTVRVIANPNALNGMIQTETPPDNIIWVVTTIAIVDPDRALTEVRFVNRDGSTDHHIGGELRAIAAGEHVYWSGLTFLDTNNRIRVWMQGCQAADTCTLDITGHIMTQET